MREEALKLNDVSLKRARKEQELGAASPLDIFQPEADFATAEIDVSQAKFQLQQSEDRVRRQIGADLDARTRSIPIILTESVLPPTGGALVDPEEAVAKAIRLRPDLKVLAQALDVDDLSIRGSTNALRPDLSLTGNYLSAGRGGTYYNRSNVTLSDGSSGSIINTIPGGFGDAVSQLFGFGYPVYSLGLTLRLPIRDRAAHANLADSLVQKRIDSLNQRSLEKQVRQQVLNAISQLESSKASVKLAGVNRDLYQKVLDAEQKKYDLGVSQIYFVLQAQRNLATANSLLVTQSTSYRRNLLTLLRMTGELLDERGITLQ
ncbi:MAG: TolC family protein [Acidobacteria bacterium]|nr:TolC family protein [Acidobacteriota bacterium]